MTGTRPRNTRPRDRKQQIITTASERFRVSGYHNVGMSDIADVVGISGPALYRHFRGKQELLYATVVDAIDKDASAFGGEHGDLRELLDAVAAGVLEHRHAGVLWDRVIVHLPEEQRNELTGRYLASIEPLRTAVAAERPELSPEAVELLLRATLAAFTAMGNYAGKLDPARARLMTVELGMTICRSQEVRPHPDAAEEQPSVSRGRLSPASRHEAVLAAATRLFAERGYDAVGMEDIAAGAAGLASSTLYYHFANKAAILVAALTRCLEALLFDLSAALDLSEEPGQALDAVLRSFVRISLEHGAAMSALLNEIVNVPAEEREKVRRMQRDYVTEWTSLLNAHRPELDPAEAKLLVHAAQTVVNTLSRTSEVWRRPAHRDDVVALGRTVLDLPGAAG
ncbi:TetR family transcriptional regulator [Saccharopolyspora sp. NPDC050642]|uniref:TetR/AcrR family transcriptional regulator n=1 Tax=Saccharopolyspora sp. NPDC050642 TaxID=3157099 RepID=UPI0033F0B8C4